MSNVNVYAGLTNKNIPVITVEQLFLHNLPEQMETSFENILLEKIKKIEVTDQGIFVGDDTDVMVDRK